MTRSGSSKPMVSQASRSLPTVKRIQGTYSLFVDVAVGIPQARNIDFQGVQEVDIPSYVFDDVLGCASILVCIYSSTNAISPKAQHPTKSRYDSFWLWNIHKTTLATSLYDPYA